MKKNNIWGIVLGIVSIISSLLFCKINGLVIGWLIGFIIGISGLLVTYFMRKKCNMKIANILCIIGTVLSIANLIMGLIITSKG